MYTARAITPAASPKAATDASLWAVISLYNPDVFIRSAAALAAVATVLAFVDMACFACAAMVPSVDCFHASIATFDSFTFPLKIAIMLSPMVSLPFNIPCEKAAASADIPNNATCNFAF